MEKIKKLLFKAFIAYKERKYKGRLRYLYFNNRSDKLLIVFSGFSKEKPVYNYVRSLRDVNSVSKLYILDDFGFRGSYYWLENGKDTPERLTTELIGKIVGGGNFHELYTMGTSKGGTCAIYYGLMFGATNIYSGACQYYVGNYLSIEQHLPILQGMLGSDYSNKDVDFLNSKLSQLIVKKTNSKSIIHLLYSKNEHTYQDHITYLIDDLNSCGIKFTEKIETFNRHSDVGKYFIPYIRAYFK